MRTVDRKGLLAGLYFRRGDQGNVVQSSDRARRAQDKGRRHAGFDAPKSKKAPEGAFKT
jgi:hypothetical protein